MAGATEIELHTTDGVTLAGTVNQPAGTPQAVVVLAHGFAASRNETEVATLGETLGSGVNVVVTFDARGHGESGGECTLGDAERHDVAAAVDLAADFDVPIILAGFSMGGAASIRYLTTPAGAGPAVGGLVAISTPSRWNLRRSLIGTYVRFLTTTRLGRGVAARHPGVRIARDLPTPPEPVEVVQGITIPTAFVHGEADRMIPARAAEELHRAASQPRMIELVPRMGHDLPLAGRNAASEATRWVLRQLG